MPRSMTGYGRGEDEEKGYRFLVEIRSINHRSIDIHVKMPRELWPMEEKIREVMQGSISRGRIDVFVTMVKAPEEAVNVKIDYSLAKSYFNALQELESYFTLSSSSNNITPMDLAGFPNVLVEDRDALNLEAAWKALSGALKKALGDLVIFREKEGNRLADDFVPRLKTIYNLAEHIDTRNPLVIDSYRERLAKRMADILPEGCLDDQRLYQEVAYFAEKSSITEELVRLKSHLHSFEDVMVVKEPVGRRMDFILQELLREVNTIASKSSDTEIAKMVVEVKSELEKIREQIQNLE